MAKSKRKERYVAREGSPFTDKEVSEVIQPALRQLRIDYGILTKKIVAKKSQDPGHPLHSYIWSLDDKSAAWAHRLELAGQLIGSVKVIIEQEEKEPIEYRAFVNVSSPRGNTYEPLVQALSREEYRRQLLGDALRELDRFRKKYRVLNELAEMVGEVIDQLQPN